MVLVDAVLDFCYLLATEEYFRSEMGMDTYRCFILYWRFGISSIPQLLPHLGCFAIYAVVLFRNQDKSE